MEVGLELAEQFRLEQEPAEVEAVDGVALEDLDDGGREVPADVAQPAGDRWGRAGEAAGPPGPASRRRRPVVERAQRGVDADVVAVQAGPGAVRLTAAEHQPPPPQPLGLRHPSRGHDAPVVGCIAASAARASPSISRTVASPAAARSGSTSSPASGTRSTSPAAEQPAELAALRRFEGAERPPQQRDDVGEPVRRERADPLVDGRQQGGVVEQDRAAAGQEALDERGARRTAACRASAPGRGAARPARVRPRSCSRRVARPRTRPWPRRSSASCSRARGHSSAAGGMVDHRQRRLDRAHPLDRARSRPSSSTPRAARSRPATTRTTNSSNTARSPAASVPRTSP